MRRSFLPNVRVPPGAAGAVSRRAFLGTAAGAGVWAAADSPDAERFEPEYARRLEEVLIVYDQVAPAYLFQEVVEIIGCLPPAAAVHFLCSRRTEAAARKRLGEHNLRANVLVCDSGQLWGDWGRDIFHVSWRQGKTVLLVPYAKTAVTRGGLTRGYEVMRSLLGSRRDVRLVPLFFEGGNIAYDTIGGDRTMFVGNSVICESRALYQRWFDRRLEVSECLDLLRRSFTVDRVVPLGRQRDGAPIPQASLLFHIDLACAIIANGVVALQRFTLPSSFTELREEVRIEVERSIRDAETRNHIEAVLGKKGVRVKLPRNEEAVSRAVETAFRAEIERLREAHAELAAIEHTFRKLGYHICRLETDWRRIRRTQSYANVLIAEDRLIMPIFPRPGAGEARIAMLPSGRQVVEVLRQPAPEDYGMDGWNRANYRTYQKVFGRVRVVRDSFFLAGGNVHCVVGTIG